MTGLWQLLVNNPILLTVFLGIGAIFGAVYDWDWLCEPKTRTNLHLERDTRRMVIFLIGLFIILINSWLALRAVFIH